MIEKLIRYIRYRKVLKLYRVEYEVSEYFGELIGMRPYISSFEEFMVRHKDLLDVKYFKAAYEYCLEHGIIRDFVEEKLIHKRN